MNTDDATQLFASLSSPIRLDIYRALMRSGPAGMVSGEIAAALGLPPTNTSFHLRALAQAGLISSVQEGRYQRYRARIPVMHDLVAFLTDQCCAGNPSACGLATPDDTADDAVTIPTVALSADRG